MEAVQKWFYFKPLGTVWVYCDGVGCLPHCIPVWQHIGQSATATSRHRGDVNLDVKATFNPNKQNLTQYGVQVTIYSAWCCEIHGIIASLGTVSAQPCFRSHVKFMGDLSLLQMTVI